MTPGKIPGNWSVFKDITQKALNFLKIRKFTDESKKLCKIMSLYFTGRRTTFEFPSRVNLSGPSLYCAARTLA